MLGSQASDAEVYATGSISSFTNSNFSDVLRWTDDNNWYKAGIDGSNLFIQKDVNGVVSTLASVPFTASANTVYALHFRAVGSTLATNVWGFVLASAGSEPSSWMATTDDSSLTSGYAGMQSLTQSGTATVTSFQSDVPGTGSLTAVQPTPSPVGLSTSSPAMPQTYLPVVMPQTPTSIHSVHGRSNPSSSPVSSTSSSSSSSKNGPTNLYDNLLDHNKVYKNSLSTASTEIAGIDPTVKATFNNSLPGSNDH